MNKPSIRGIASKTCLALALFPAAAAGAELGATRFYPAGPLPMALAIGDLDADTAPDIAVVNREGHLRLLFNDGNGAFSAVEHRGLWPASSYTTDVAIGDLDGDGDRDLAVSFTTMEGELSVLFNDGAGSFTAPINHPVCASSSSVAIGDLDADGDADLADTGVCFKAGVLLNDGAGSFTGNGVYGNGYASLSVAIADLDGNAFPDIAYVNNGIQNITVLLNLGDATFGPHRWYTTGDGPYGLSVADLDGDGDQDIAVANSYGGSVSVLLNHGDGTFAAQVGYAAGAFPSSVAAADVDRDGDADLLVTERDANRLALLRNQGAGTFAAPVRFAVGQAPLDVAAGFLDGDSLLDVAVLDGGSADVAILLGGGEGGESPPPSPPLPPSGLTASAVTGQRIDLAWTDASTNETGFRIERCKGAGCGNFAEIAAVGPGVTSFANGGLTRRTTYRYRVRAVNAAGASPYSNVAQATTPRR